MRGMQMNGFDVSEGKYKSPMLGSWEIDKLGKPEEVVYCEVPEDIPVLQEMMNQGYQGINLFVQENSPVFLLPKDRTQPGIYLGTVAKVKEDTGRHRLYQCPAAESEISDVVQTIEAGRNIPEEIVEERDIVSVLTSDTSVKQVQRFQECTIFENYFGNNKEIGLSVDYFKKKHTKTGGFTTDFRYRRKQNNNVAGGWVSKDYVQKAVDAMKEYAILKDVCSDCISDAKSTKEISRQWDEIVKSINGMRRISDMYFTDEAKSGFNDFANITLEKKALEIAKYSKQDGIDQVSAQQAFAWLLKSNHPKRLNRALDIAERYVPGAIDIAKTRIKNVAFRNDTLYGSPFPPANQTIQVEARMDAPKRISQNLLDNAGYRSAASDDITKNVQIRKIVPGINTAHRIDLNEQIKAKSIQHPQPRAIYERLLRSGDTDDIEKAIQIANKFLTKEDARRASTYWTSASRRYNLNHNRGSWNDGDVLLATGTNGVYERVTASNSGNTKPISRPTLPPRPDLTREGKIASPPPLPWQEGGSGAYSRPASKPPTMRSTLPPRPVFEERASTPPPINAEERRASGLPPLSNERSQSEVRVRKDAYIPWANEADVLEIETPPPLPAVAKKKARASSLPPPPPCIMDASKRMARETILPPALPSLKMLPDRLYSERVNAA